MGRKFRRAVTCAAIVAGALGCAAHPRGAARADYAPISTKPFKDNAKHYRDKSDRSDYARYDEREITAIADNLLLYQRENGGWPPNWDPQRMLSAEEVRQVEGERSQEDASFDNRSTYTHLEYLAAVYGQTRDARYADGCLRGLQYLFKAQYPSGGFPHSFPRTDDYRPHITFMDDVMPGVLATLRRAAHGAAPFEWLAEDVRRRSAQALQHGDACVLALQVKVGGEPTVWAGQYDEHTLQPTMGRSFELPSLVSSESVSVVRYLMSIEAPPPEVVRAIEGAVRWFERSAIHGLRVEEFPAEVVRYKNHTSKTDKRVVADANAPAIWARFYEIESNRPFMANRDGVKVFSLAEVQRERRTGYSWYGYYGASDLLNDEYPRWRQRAHVEPGLSK